MTYINYRFAIEHIGGLTEHSSQHKVGTTFASIRDEGWSWATRFIPLRLEWEAWAWPGGYPIFYVVKDGGVLCPKCANKELDRTLDPDDDQFFVIGSDINYEDGDLFCDHCGTQIEPAYGSPDE